MRIEEFTDVAPGRLIPVPGGHAFLPDPLPPRLEATWGLARRLEVASAALAELVGQARSIGNWSLVLGPLVAREAVESARIEGTRTHVEDVVLHKAVGPPRDRQRALDNLEAIRYEQALALGEQWIRSGRPLNGFVLRALHQELLRDTRGSSSGPGEVRSVQVLIGTRGESPAEARFVPPPPEFVPEALDRLVGFITSDEFFPALVRAALVHYQFETIHPFQDGNGRLGRILLSLQLMSMGNMDRPILFLSPFFERHRDDYVGLLKRVSTHADWTAWLIFFLEAVRYEAADGLARVKTIVRLDQEYRERVRRASRSQTPLAAIDLITQQLVVSVPELKAFASCTFPTAKSAILQLVDLGILEPLPGTYPQRWWARELLDTAYGA